MNLFERFRLWLKKRGAEAEEKRIKDYERRRDAFMNSDEYKLSKILWELESERLDKQYKEDDLKRIYKEAMREYEEEKIRTKCDHCQNAIDGKIFIHPQTGENLCVDCADRIGMEEAG